MNVRHPIWVSHKNINPFYAIGLFLYPLKTSEKQKLSIVSRGIERDQCHKKG